MRAFPLLSQLCLYQILAVQPNIATKQLLPLDADTNCRNMMVRLNNEPGHRAPSSGVRGGRVEVSFDDGNSWGTICATDWSFREANVVCRQLGLGYASMANQSEQYGNNVLHPWIVVGAVCRGTEKRLKDCFRESKYPRACNASHNNVAVVHCVSQSADLSLGLHEMERSVVLDTVAISNLTCAMEENCLSRDAYVIRRTQPHALRRLLRFTTKAENVGNADFSPYANYEQWQWHECHRHFHSMNVFAIFDIYDFDYRKIAEGHKASFCLMDTSCVSGITPKYTCGNRTQGISVGCADTYANNLDCQWVDVTNLPRNQMYILRVAINPEYKIGEISFENNGAECLLNYTGHRATTRITRCRRAPLWFRRW